MTFSDRDDDVDIRTRNEGYVPATMGESLVPWAIWRYILTRLQGHYVENTGNTTLRFLEIFNTGNACPPLQIRAP